MRTIKASSFAPSSEKHLQKSANDETLKFACIAAHDLRSPLSAVMGLLQILASRIRPRLDERENNMLSVAIDSLQCLEKLMSDILSYSTAQRWAGNLQLISLEEPLKKALANLQMEIKITDAIIHYDPLPQIYADSTQMILLFQNLIGNAIKYRKTDTAPDIMIKANRQGQNWIISIADNGQGFEQKDAERIFEPFTRLQTSCPRGSGIGLSTCQRIVERMNGKIWAESKKGFGSTFFFSLPVKSEKVDG